MTAIDLSKKLKRYKTGWVAFDKKHNIVAFGKTFKDISEKVKKNKDDVVLLPASNNYFGYITLNG